MVSFEEVQEVVSNIRYLDWKMIAHKQYMGWSGKETSQYMIFLQVVFNAVDSNDPNGPVVEQKCRWWLVDTDRGVSEVVRTAYKAIESAVLHEMHENFYYDGKRVMDPHRNLTE